MLGDTLIRGQRLIPLQDEEQNFAVGLDGFCTPLLPKELIAVLGGKRCATCGSDPCAPGQANACQGEFGGAQFWTPKN